MAAGEGSGATIVARGGTPPGTASSQHNDKDTIYGVCLMPCIQIPPRYYTDSKLRENKDVNDSHLTHSAGTPALGTNVGYTSQPSDMYDPLYETGVVKLLYNTSFDPDP